MINFNSKIATVILIISYLLLCSSLSSAQQKDCHPNCQITFDQVFALRCPSNGEIVGTVAQDWIIVKSVNIQNDNYDFKFEGQKCGDEVAKMLESYRQEDVSNWSYLRNMACSYQSGWVEKIVGQCQAGGPPPCCPVDHWRKVDPAVSLAFYKNLMKKVYDQRMKSIGDAIESCRQSYTSDATSQFNELKSQASKQLAQLELDYPNEAANDENTYGANIRLLTNEFQDEVNKGNSSSPVKMQQLMASLSNTNSQLKSKTTTSSTKQDLNNNLTNSNNNTYNQPNKPANNNTSGLNPGQRQTQQYINNAQNPNSDAIQQALALNQAKINARLNGGSAWQQRQQIQQVQQQQQQTNTQTIVSGVTQIGGVVANYFNQKAQQQQQEEQAKEDRENELEAQKRQQAAEDAEYEREAENERSNNININNKILGTHLSDPFRSLTSNNPSLTIVYYVAWYRQDNGNTVYIFPNVVIKKYSDNTWPFLSDIKTEMKSKLTEAGVTNADPQLLGYYTTPQAQQATAVELINNANNTGLAVKPLYLKNAEGNANTTHTQSSQDFWKN